MSRRRSAPARWSGPERAPAAGTAAAGHVPFTRRAKTLLELSLREALALRHRHIGTEHILLAFARLPTALGTRVLADLGVNPDAIRRAALDALDGQADSA